MQADRSIRNSELWGGLVWLVFGLAVTWMGWDLGLGQVHEPGSGFAIFWLGIITAGLAVAVIVGAVIRGGEPLGSLWAGTRWAKVVLVISLLLVFGFFFEAIGFIPSSLILLLVLMRFVDPVPWRWALPVALGAVFGVWFFLALALKIRLPAGILEGIIG
jgi:putative tricarboxylic transport membrane protein